MKSISLYLALPVPLFCFGLHTDLKRFLKKHTRLLLWCTPESNLSYSFLCQQELLGTLRRRKCLVIYLVDLFDFDGSFLYNLPKVVGEFSRAD